MNLTRALVRVRTLIVVHALRWSREFMLTDPHDPHDPHVPRVFASKVDLWLRVVTWAGAFVPIGALITLAMRGQRGALWLIPVLLIPGALSLWILWSTDYTFTGTDLHIRSGPFRWRVPVHSVRAVSPTRNPLSSPALSLDRLRIEYGYSQTIMVSPTDKTGFLDALQARSPVYAERIRVSPKHCSDLPAVFWLDHDYPRERLEQRLTVLSTAGGGWISVARCNDCGQIWRVDKSDGRSVDLAIKVASLDGWRDEDDRAARLEYLKRSYGGDDVAKCIWAGCQNRALETLAMCAEHAYDRMGATVRT